MNSRPRICFLLQGIRSHKLDFHSCMQLQLNRNQCGSKLGTQISNWVIEKRAEEESYLNGAEGKRPAFPCWRDGGRKRRRKRVGSSERELLMMLKKKWGSDEQRSGHSISFATLFPSLYYALVTLSADPAATSRQPQNPSAINKGPRSSNCHVITPWKIKQPRGSITNAIL